MSYKKSILHSLGHFNDVFDYFFFHRWIIWKKHLRNLIGAIRGKTRTHRIFVLKNPQQFQPRICLECKCLKTWRSDYTPYDWYTISNLILRRLCLWQEQIRKQLQLLARFCVLQTYLVPTIPQIIGWLLMITGWWSIFREWKFIFQIIFSRIHF